MKRNIDIGAVISKVFKTYGDYAGVLLGVAAIVFLINAVFQFAGNDSWVLGAIGGLIGIVLGQLYTGMVVELVSDTRDGKLDQSVGGLFNAVTPVLLPLIGASILAGIGIVIGFVLCILPGIFLITIWSVIAPSIVVERKGVFEAFGRSWELVKGNFWQVLGVIVIFWILTFVIVGIAGAIGAAVGVVLAFLLVWIVGFLVAPLSALASSILFFELRDLETAGAPGGGATAPPPIAGLPDDPASPPPPPPAPPAA